MKENYPISVHCSFSDFPPMIKIICGPDIPLPFSYGSRVVMAKTALCGVVQGSYIDGEALPDYFMIYSDTGEDDAFNLKLSFYGWGTFYVAKIDDAYCHLEIRKGIKVESGSISKKFEVKDTWETMIPSSTVLSSSVTIPAIYAIVRGGSNSGGVTFDDSSNTISVGNSSVHMVTL
jgi:hypothetical protein